MPKKNRTNGKNTKSNAMVFKRQKDIFNPNIIQTSINIIGAGNGGSTIVFALAKLGIKYITVYDFDIVENHNLPSQFYALKDVGKLKTSCLKKHIQNFTGIKINEGGKYKHQRLFGIVILCVDSMKERKRICKVMKKNPPEGIIDIRMGGSTIEVYTRKTPEEYETTLVDKVQRDPCSARYICYNSLMTGALVANQIKRIFNNEKIKLNILLDIETLRFV